MPAVAVVTIILAAVLVLALAAYLITIAWYLRKTVHTLGLVTFGVRAIAHRVVPLEELIGQIEGDLTTVDDALGGLLYPDRRLTG